MHKKKPKLNKGKIIGDGGADRRLAPAVNEAGFECEWVKPDDRKQHTSDPYIFTKYTKGRYPILTRDYSMYTWTTEKASAVGFIEHENFTATEFKDYVLQFTSELSGLNMNKIRNKVWRIPKKGKAFIKVDLTDLKTKKKTSPKK